MVDREYGGSEQVKIALKILSGLSLTVPAAAKTGMTVAGSAVLLGATVGLGHAALTNQNQPNSNSSTSFGSQVVKQVGVCKAMPTPSPQAGKSTKGIGLCVSTWVRANNPSNGKSKGSGTVVPGPASQSTLGSGNAGSHAQTGVKNRTSHSPGQ